MQAQEPVSPNLPVSGPDRYMTLTHNGGPGWADPAVERDGTFAEAKVGGLTPFGIEVVAEMNRMGMVVDISHVHDVTVSLTSTEREGRPASPQPCSPYVC